MAPNLVAKALSLQYREGFCNFLEVKFSGQFHGYSTRVGVNWVDVARHHRGEPGKALEESLCSLGSLHLGRIHGDQRQVNASREMYGRALHHVARALHNPFLAIADETLAAAILLGAYEMVNGTGQKLWMLHSRGISSLLQLRGPSAHTHGLGRTLLVSFRGFLVFEALVRGEKCFLEGQEWRSIIPSIKKWEEQCGKASRLGELIEYAFYEIACCPGFLARTRNLVASIEVSKAEREELSYRITCCRQTLCEIQSHLAANLRNERQPVDQNFLDFIGSIPVTAADSMGRFSLEGIGSAIALLQQLLVVLQSDQARRSSAIWKCALPVEKSPFALLNDPSVMKAIAGGKHTFKPAGPQRQENPESWFDHVSMSMGLVNEMPPI